VVIHAAAGSQYPLIRRTISQPHPGPNAHGWVIEPDYALAVGIFRVEVTAGSVEAQRARQPVFLVHRADIVEAGAEVESKIAPRLPLILHVERICMLAVLNGQDAVRSLRQRGISEHE